MVAWAGRCRQFVLVGEARPQLRRFRHRCLGLGIERSTSDLQRPHRKPAILLGAPHLPHLDFPLARVLAAERWNVPPACKSRPQRPHNPEDRPGSVLTGQRQAQQQSWVGSLNVDRMLERLIGVASAASSSASSEKSGARLSSTCSSELAAVGSVMASGPLKWVTRFLGHTTKPPP